MLSGISLGLSVGSEIVIAAALGAAALGWLTREDTGEPVWRVVRRWTVASAGGLAGAFAVALLLRAVTTDAASAGVFAHLDAGTTIGIGAVAAFAAFPTMLRLCRPPGTDPAEAT